MSTQQDYPWRATLRTFIAVAASSSFALAVAIPVLVDGMGVYMSERTRAWLLGVSVFILSLSATLTRIMAIPAVDKALRSVGMSSAPAYAPRHESPPTELPDVATRAPGDDPTLF